MSFEPRVEKGREGVWKGRVWEDVRLILRRMNGISVKRENGEWDEVWVVVVTGMGRVESIERVVWIGKCWQGKERLKKGGYLTSEWKGCSSNEE